MKHLHFILIALLIAASTITGRAQQEPQSFTQWKINEFAASCVNAETVFKGLKGSRKATETPAQFSARVKGYFAALDHAIKDLKPLSKTPAAKDKTPENIKLWQKIVGGANRLTTEVSVARAAWAAYPKEGDKVELGKKLLTALDTIQSVLNGLRDVRP